MPTRRIIIKKYENRRLYDATNSRYVNLDEIAQMVRDGAEVQVVDAATGEDLTRMVLTQIIAENAKVADSGFPVDMLRQMVIASGRVGQEGIVGYMKAMSDMYQNTFKAFGGTAPLPFDFAARETGGENGNATAPSVEELRRRVEDLERMVEKAAQGKRGSKSKRAARPKKK